MSSFETLHRTDIIGKLTCFDRMILKGHLTRLYPDGAFKAFLSSEGVLLKDVGPYLVERTKELRDHVLGIASQAARPYHYLASAHTVARGNSKEDMARRIATDDGIKDGLVCVLGAVEPCMSFELYKNKDTHHLEMRRRQRRCLHYYFYYLDPELGLFHIRLQSWFPFEIQVWVNGHAALAVQLDKAKVAYTCHENSFAKISDWPRAQALAERFAKRNWVALLDALAKRVNPILPAIEEAGFGSYYWVADQVEVSTDIAFASRPVLEALLPHLFAYASAALSAEDVLRFLGRKLHPALAVEVLTDARRRPEGWRVKHRMGANSIKVYDKANVLRVETTINQANQFRSLRERDGKKAWLPMRKGIAELPRQFQVGAGANERYLEALGHATNNGEGVAALDALCRPLTRQGHKVARFNPLAKADVALFRAALAGEHTINGFRNHDLVARLYPHPASSPEEVNRRCQRTSRLITKLRGHGLVAKVTHRRLYRVTPAGQRLLGTLITFHDRAFPAAYAAAA
ncbi:MAG: hypothetical protein ACRDX8_08980 [Acidimicrobiales bacterium]